MSDKLNSLRIGKLIEIHDQLEIHRKNVEEAWKYVCKLMEKKIIDPEDEENDYYIGLATDQLTCNIKEVDKAIQLKMKTNKK